MSLLYGCDLKTVAKIRPVVLDDLTSVRYVHINSFQIFASENHSKCEIGAHIEL